MKVRVFIFIIFLFESTYAQNIAPDFTITDINGVTRNLYSELNNNKTVVLDFFSTNCGSCISGIPILEDIWQSYGSNGDSLWVWGVEVNGITDSAIIAFQNQYSFSYPVFGTYTDDIIVPLYSVTYTPQYWVVCPSYSMKFVSIYNLDEAIKGCKESLSVNEFYIENNDSWFVFEKNKLNMFVDNNYYPAKLYVYNLFGKIINVFEISDNSQIINLNNLTSGVYFISFFTSKGNALNGKILKCNF